MRYCMKNSNSCYKHDSLVTVLNLLWLMKQAKMSICMPSTMGMLPMASKPTLWMFLPVVIATCCVLH